MTPTIDRRSELPLDPDRPPHLTWWGLGLVFVGGVAGTGARYLGETWLGTAGGWPVGTFAINLSGAFVLGVLLESLARRGPDRGRRRRLRLLLGTGFCGAFTTYSALATETALLMRDGALTLAVAYGLASLVLGFGASVAGIWCGTRTGGSRP